MSIESGVLPASEYDFTKFRGTKPWTLNADCVVEQYFDALERLSQNICDLRELALQVLSKNRFIIGEFGQSYWLDKRTGFSPNVTASHAYTPEFFQSLCIPTQPIRTIGSCKAYDTKVGTHIFLTQMEDGLPLTQKLKKLEFGATTGRQRMVGWWDSVEKADVLRYGGYQDIVINKLDVLSHDYEGDGDLKICVGYKACNGGILNEVPRSDSVRRQLEPIYETVPGWKEDISKIRSFADLPENAQNYVKQCMKSVIRLAQRGGHTIPLPNLRYIGVGPDPSQIIKDAPEVSELIS